MRVHHSKNSSPVPRRKAVGLAAVLLGSTFAFGIASAAPAAAATPQCGGFVMQSAAVDSRSHYWETPSVSNGNRSISCLLGRGSAGAAVLILQRSLNTCYNAGITESGYGYQTQQAVRWVQTTHGVAADGVFGPATNMSMKWYGRQFSYYTNSYSSYYCTQWWSHMS